MGRIVAFIGSREGQILVAKAGVGEAEACVGEAEACVGAAEAGDTPDVVLYRVDNHLYKALMYADITFLPLPQRLEVISSSYQNAQLCTENKTIPQKARTS